MNYIDIIIIAILALSVISGLVKGFVREAASLAALALGIWGAIELSSFTASKLYELFDMRGQFTGIAAFIITFVAIVVAIHFIGLLADKLVSAVSLGLFNRILGGIFGLLKSTFIMSVVFSIFNAIDARKPFLPKDKTEQSALYNSVSDIVPALFPIIGEGTLEDSFDRFRKNSEDTAI
ncbi:MAG: CvpA family protein [Bacteroidales bacterium]|jgi:membrane protein required for colicin V production|nr:CvpA family protein [Bacteroidales bacterium]